MEIFKKRFTKSLILLVFKKYVEVFHTPNTIFFPKIGLQYDFYTSPGNIYSNIHFPINSFEGTANAAPKCALKSYNFIWTGAPIRKYE